MNGATAGVISRGATKPTRTVALWEQSGSASRHTMGEFPS